MGTIGVLEVYDRSQALRGNAAQDAPRPLSNATRAMGVISVRHARLSTEDPRVLAQPF